MAPVSGIAPYCQGRGQRDPDIRGVDEAPRSPRSSERWPACPSLLHRRWSKRLASDPALRSADLGNLRDDHLRRGADVSRGPRDGVGDLLVPKLAQIYGQGRVADDDHRIAPGCPRTAGICPLGHAHGQCRHHTHGCRGAHRRRAGRGGRDRGTRRDRRPGEVVMGATGMSPRRRPRPSATDGCIPAISGSFDSEGYLTLHDRSRT